MSKWMKFFILVLVMMFTLSTCSTLYNSVVITNIWLDVKYVEECVQTLILNEMEKEKQRKKGSIYIEEDSGKEI